jgi:DNA polymerase-3 subunit alpha
VRLAGLVTSLKKIFTKKNEAMCFFNLQDKSGSIEVLVFPKTMAKFGDLLEVDRVLEVTGTLSDKDGEPKLLADSLTTLPTDEIYLLALGEKEKQHILKITLKTTPKPEVLQVLRNIIENHPGNTEVVLEIQNSSKVRTPLKARTSPQLLKELKELSEVLRVGTEEIS